jgi:hypothetical protein
MYTVITMPKENAEANSDWLENALFCSMITTMIVSLLIPLAIYTVGCKRVEDSLETLFVRPMTYYDRIIEFIFSPLHLTYLDISTTELLTRTLPKLIGRLVIMPLVWPVVYGSDLGLMISTHTCFLTVCPDTLCVSCYKAKLHYTEYLWWYMPLGFQRASYGFQGIQECEKKIIK